MRHGRMVHAHAVLAARLVACVEPQREQVVHRSLVLRVVHGAAGKLVQPKRTSLAHIISRVGDEGLVHGVVLGSHLVASRRAVVVVVLAFILVGWLVAAEGIHLVWHTDAAEERSQNVHLLHDIHNHASHRTRPVKEHNEPVVLAVRLDGEVLEQVLVPLVGGQQVHIQRARLGLLLTVMGVRCLLGEEGLDHCIHRGVRFRRECVVVGSHQVPPVLALGARVQGFGDLIVDLRVRHDDLCEIELRHPHRDIIVALPRVRLLAVLLHPLLLGLRGLGSDPVQLFAGLVGWLAFAISLTVLRFTVTVLRLAVAVTIACTTTVALHGLGLWLAIGAALVIPHEPGCLHHILERFGFRNHIHHLLLAGRERHGEFGVLTNLEVQVQAVDERHLADGRVVQFAEHTGLHQPVVTLAVITSEAGILALDESLNACVLNNVDVLLGHLLVSIAGVGASQFVGQADPSGDRGVQGVAHLVGQQQVVHLLRHASPVRHIQDASLGVEPCVLALGIKVHLNVFGGHDASEHRTRLVRLVAHCALRFVLVVVVVEHEGIVPHISGAVNPLDQDIWIFFVIETVEM